MGKNIVFITGITLSGKSFFGKFLKGVGDNSIPYLSTGDYYKSLSSSYSSIDNDSIQKTDLSIEFENEIRKKVIEHIDHNTSSIVEGFPRSIAQVEFIKEHFSNEDVTIIYITTSLLEVIKRHYNRPRGKTILFSLNRYKSARCNEKRILKELNKARFKLFRFKSLPIKLL